MTKPIKTKPDPAKPGPAYKYGEPTVPVMLRVPRSLIPNIPEPIGTTLVMDAIKKYKK